MKTKPLILAFNFRCNHCNKIFEGSGLPDEAYGEFILRSMSNKIAYLNVFEDFFIKEVENLFDNFIKTKKTNSVEESTLFQAILPVALDPAPDGSVYQIELAPVCPHCGSREMASWGEAKPLRLTSEDIKSVTHDGWDKLSSQEKKIKIENAITDYLVKHAE